MNQKLKENMFLATYVIILGFLFLNIGFVFKYIFEFMSILKPFFIGIGIAFIVNILMKNIENKLIPLVDKKNILKKSKRGVSLLLSLLALFLLFTALIFFIVPQLMDSIRILIDSVPGYLKKIEEAVTPYITSAEVLNVAWESILGAWKDILQVGSQFLTQSVTGIVNATFTITSGVFTAILGFVIAIYMLISKESLILGMKKICYATLKKSKAEHLLKVGILANDTFSKFIGGQCTEALIVGFLCFIGMLIMRMPYPLLISVIIGFTNMLPIFGPFIGTIPAAFILLMVNPAKAIWFVVFIVVLQQIESGLIYPRVVGSSIGLSAIWVLLAITVGGSLFGLLGMLLGVPTVAVLYNISREMINERLKSQKIKIKDGFKEKC